MSQSPVDEIALEMAAEGCAETEATVEQVGWRRHARAAAAQLGRNDVVIRVRDGVITACLSGWPRTAVEKALQTAALRRAAVSSWIEPLTTAARQHLQAAHTGRTSGRSSMPRLRGRVRDRSTTLRLVPDPVDQD